MKNSILSKFPDYYAMVQLEIEDGPKLQQRKKSIIDMASILDFDFWKGCIHLFYGKSPQVNPKSKEDFVAYLCKNDPTFTSVGRDLEVRLLAGFALSYYIEQNNTTQSNKVALAMITGAFGGAIEMPFILDEIRSITGKLSRGVRTTEEIDEELGELKFELPEYAAGDMEDSAQIDERIQNIELGLKKLDPVFDIIENLHSRMAILEEESNIHWWIFRGYSNIHRCSFKTLKSHMVALTVGIELGDHTNLLPPPISADAFLTKLISEAGIDCSIPEPLADFVNAAEEEFVGPLMERFEKSGLQVLCPVFFALQKRREGGFSESWTDTFFYSTKISSGYRLTPLELARQIYLEYLQFFW